MSASTLPRGIFRASKLAPDARVAEILRANPGAVFSPRTLRPVVGHINGLPEILAKMAKKGILAIIVYSQDSEEIVYRTK